MIMWQPDILGPGRDIGTGTGHWDRDGTLGPEPGHWDRNWDIGTGTGHWVQEDPQTPPRSSQTPIRPQFSSIWAPLFKGFGSSSP